MVVVMFEYIVKNISFDIPSINDIENDILTYYIFPCVYLIYCSKKRLLYIGETTNIQSRLKQHLKNKNKSILKSVTLIFSHFFNKSAVLDIEANLIQNLGAEGSFKLLNANDGISSHMYYQKYTYLNTFKDIWTNQLLKEKNIVKKDLLDIQNSNLFKFSPYKSLSLEQHQAVKDYLNFLLINKSKTSFIEGCAGTGKTIVAVYIVKLLMTTIDEDAIDNDYESHELIALAARIKKEVFYNKPLKIALVIPRTSLRKTLKNVFRNIYGLSQNIVIGPNELKALKYDILLVDESHRLKRRKNITGYGEFDKTNKHFGLDKYNGNELDWVILSSQYVLLFYDANQSVRPSDVDKSQFETLQNKSNYILLDKQMRVVGGNDYISFVDNLLTCKDIARFESSNYELKMFNSMKSLVDALQEKENSIGLCRLISGYSWEWVSKKDGSPDALIDDVELRWNKINYD